MLQWVTISSVHGSLSFHFSLLSDTLHVPILQKNGLQWLFYDDFVWIRSSQLVFVCALNITVKIWVSLIQGYNCHPVLLYKCVSVLLNAACINGS